MGNLKRIYGSIFFLLVLALAGCESELVSVESIDLSEDIRTELQKTYQPQRGEYGLGKYKGQSFLIEGVFKNLPPLPDDFFIYNHQLLSGKMQPAALCALEQRYYSQPEFFPNFLTAGLHKYKEPDPSRWTPEGYGTYPHEMEASVIPGAEMMVCTFFRASFGVQTYQGFSLRPIYPVKANIGGESYSVNSLLTREYFFVEVTPHNVLLEPAYFIFEPRWVQKVQVQVRVANNTPPGVYAIGFDVGRADVTVAGAWATEYLESYRGLSGIRISEPQFLMYIKVEEVPG